FLSLDDRFGNGDGALWAELWERSVQPPRPPDSTAARNAVDWLDALQVVAEDGGTDVPGVLLDLATYRALTGSRAVLGDGPTTGPGGAPFDGRANLQGQALRLDTLSGRERTTTVSEGPFVGGCATFIGANTTTAALTVPIAATAIPLEAD